MQEPRRDFFQSRLARQTFWGLLLGSLLIMATSLSVFGIYLMYGRHTVSHARLANEVVKAVTLAKTLPPKELSQMLRLLGGRGLRVRINHKPLPRFQMVELTDQKSIRRYVHKHYKNINLSIQLTDGRWLNIQGHQIHHQWLLTGLILASVLLLCALLGLCIWTVKRLGVPMRTFTKAAKRFGMDVQAPPLAPMGSAEMREVIQAFNEMQERVRRLLHDRTQMLAAISHDLRTPITRLQLRAEYLKGTDQYDKAVADLNEMEQMISSILSFARDYVRTEAMERVDLNALLASLCDEMTDVGHSVTYHSELQRTPYFGRISALKRVFNNLIENAVKYGDKAEVSLKRKGDALQIKVSDEGPGIPKDQFEKVFAPFYRVDPSRSPKKGGSGLGLSVARDIVLAHGGEIALFNREPGGLTVLVTLPLQDDSE